MGAKRLRILLWDDGHSESRHLRMTIANAQSFECHSVGLDKLDEALRAQHQNEPPIILLAAGHSATQLNSTLKRIRASAANVPVLIVLTATLARSTHA